MPENASQLELKKNIKKILRKKKLHGLLQSNSNSSESDSPLNSIQFPVGMKARDIDVASYAPVTVEDQDRPGVVLYRFYQAYVVLKHKIDQNGERHWDGQFVFYLGPQFRFGEGTGMDQGSALGALLAYYRNLAGNAGSGGSASRSWGLFSRSNLTHELTCGDIYVADFLNHEDDIVNLFMRSLYVYVHDRGKLKTLKLVIGVRIFKVVSKGLHITSATGTHNNVMCEMVCTVRWYNVM
ncbi:hypothetical protein SCHPADRAFT_893173 [Schizopora paradoxa]|uniref:Uncharacterized protein n=1 Tax=Schizopora paradoxa TaxID=27342 RepID=A0A0H2RX24_9AGAM|nr:hypothetical protein SCHPADRAFT_893173 [Schizopora paradoxa]